MEARLNQLEKENEQRKKQSMGAKEMSSHYATPEEKPELRKDADEARDPEAHWSQWWWTRPTAAPMRDHGEPSSKKMPERPDNPSGGTEPSGDGARETTEVEKLMKGMVKLMEGMQLMQTQILEVKRDKGIEVVKSSVSELPKLQEWRVETAPLDLTDWFLTIEPALGDLSDGSQQWWDGMIRAARAWYALHQEMSPLQRVNHVPEAPPELKGVRYQRLEKRTTALLMAAIPSTQQEEVIAGKDISTMSILCRLMLSYQPGGLSEKAAILSALDSPEEAQSLASAVTGLRKWLRWHRRAGEVGVTRPDSTIQVKGLGRLMKKVLKDNADLAFRIQLAKSSLQIDTTPTEGSVMTYANHLLAEVEQIAHQDKRRREKEDKVPDLRLKRAEETSKGDGKASRAEKGGGATCRFFLLDDGCKKGGQCTWVHQLDDRKRCWTCGSTSHFSPNCDRPSASATKDGVKDAPERTGLKGWDGKGKPVTKRPGRRRQRRSRQCLRRAILQRP